MRGLFAFSEAHVAHMQASDQICDLVSQQLSGSCNFPDEQRDGLLAQIKDRYGSSLLAVLIYGSYLRGKRDTLLDFYVLLDSYDSMSKAWQGWLAKALPPNVYQIKHGSPPDEIRAKYALLTLDRFEYAVKSDFHSYFWGRFAQPCGILWCRDEFTRRRLIDAIGQAASTFSRRVVPGLPDVFDAEELWTRGLSLSYQCELRSEPPGHAEKLFNYWPDYYRSISQALAGEELGYEEDGQDGDFINKSSPGTRRWSPVSWWLRRMHGKVLSVLRIFKAALTFDGGLDYLLWKIKRHSGVYIEPSRLQRKYPLIFAWPLLWRLYRKGAFR
jgi:hypothetical protein